MDYILDNKKNLPTYEEANAKYMELRERWNTQKHFRTEVQRMEMYKTSVNEKAPALTQADMVDLFWIINDKPITFTASGLTMQVKNQKYTYEVFDTDGRPSSEFLKNNVGRKFYVAYDPDCMDYVKFYVMDTSKKLRFFADAGTYLTANRALQDQTSEDHKLLKDMEIAAKKRREEMHNETDSLLREHGIHEDQNGMKPRKLKGLNKKTRKKPMQEQEDDVSSIGEYTKAVSNIDWTDYIDKKYNNN